MKPRRGRPPLDPQKRAEYEKHKQRVEEAKRSAAGKKQKQQGGELRFKQRHDPVAAAVQQHGELGFKHHHDQQQACSNTLAAAVQQQGGELYFKQQAALVDFPIKPASLEVSVLDKVL